ncbi:hypothetical protein SI65_07066 [Aspergillus cristatus]|uniref:Bud22 domain-containing protein n=1 Tax=Aspergillus cristatus TaxID=573508 RepID=A0A1E3B9B3_ASPCR|nr:hypothetical protein SI65_07066 [Aspergillus cristatus]
MPKRKHSDLDATKTPVANDATTRIANRLSVKFDYEVNVLSRALKLSRGFEKQKMGRRGKKARSEEGAKPGTVGRLEEENKILKALDMDKTASKYLLKQLARTKRIAEAPAFIYFRENLKKNISLEGPQSAAEGNVLARLYKSNPVKEVFPGIMEGFRKLLGLEDVAKGKQEKQGGPSESTARGKNEGAKESKQPKAKVKDEGAVEERDVDMNMDVNMDEEAASGSEDSDSFAQFNSRLAGSDSESDDDDNDRPDPMAISPSPSRSPSPDLDLEPSASPSASPAKKPKTKTSKPAPATSTTFLPSLSMGGYVSGSESEPSDDEDAQPRRKNRMGQQARRALWEKKFGSRANHVKKQAVKEKRNRDSGWDVRRGATGGGSGSATGANREMRGNKLQRGGENKRTEPKDDKPIHPSWEAARKAKEQQASTAAFKGKKVTFD